MAAKENEVIIPYFNMRENFPYRCSIIAKYFIFCFHFSGARYLETIIPVSNSWFKLNIEDEITARTSQIFNDATQKREMRVPSCPVSFVCVYEYIKVVCQIKKEVEFKKKMFLIHIFINIIILFWWVSDFLIDVRNSTTNW